MMQKDSCILGWGPDEFNTVSSASGAGLFVNAADWAINLSVFTNFNISSFTQKTHTPVQIIEHVHTVTFVFTDGDNIQWQLAEFSVRTR